MAKTAAKPSPSIDKVQRGFVAEDDGLQFDAVPEIVVVQCRCGEEREAVRQRRRIHCD